MPSCVVLVGTMKCLLTSGKRCRAESNWLEQHYELITWSKMRFGWFKVNATFSCSCFNHAEGVVVLGILNNSTVRKQEMSWSPRRQCSIEIFFCFALINFCPLVDFSCVFEVALCVICPRICSMCVCFITHSLHVCCYDCGHPVRFQEHC